jgi:two-component system cell cycle response regulator
MSYSRALIVDDSKIARVTLKKKLEQRGLETVVAEHAQQALELLKTEPVDVIFMDHMMPGMDGFEATQQIKANKSTAHLPIIMCSGKENDNYLDEARAIGATHVLPKPTGNEALDAVFAELENACCAPAAPVIRGDLNEADQASSALAEASMLSSSVADNRDEQLNEMLIPLSQQVTTLGERLNSLHGDISAQMTASSKAIEGIHAMEQKQAIARAASEDAIKDELAALMDERLSALYIPAAEDAQEKTRATLRAELNQELDKKLHDSMTPAVAQLKAAMPQPPSASDIQQLISQTTEQRLGAIHSDLQKNQQQLGAALRVELERHLKNELARQLPPAPDMDALRATIMDEMSSELAASIPPPPSKSGGRFQIALTLLSTLIAGVAVALHFVL